MMENPRYGCTERFTACWGNCPKDNRGGYGYKAWLADVHGKQAEERERKHRDREEVLRSEECTWKNKRRGAKK